MTYRQIQNKDDKLISKVIRHLFDAELHLNKEKCQLEKTKIKHLGHLFTSNGINTEPAKMKAIEQLKMHLFTRNEKIS